MNCESEYGYPKCMGAAALGQCTCPPNTKAKARVMRVLFNACQEALRFVDPKKGDGAPISDEKELAKRLRRALESYDRLYR